MQIWGESKIYFVGMDFFYEEEEMKWKQHNVDKDNELGIFILCHWKSSYDLL